MNNAPTTEDRIWAVISHLSSLAFGMGILLPIIGWSDQRRKSNYASFQCLQALGYQSLGFTVWVLLCLLVMIPLLLSLIGVPGLMGDGTANSDSLIGIWAAVFSIVTFGLFGLYFLLPIIAAVACGLGRDFRYPIMGNRLARYLRYDPAHTVDESAWLMDKHEDRWVAAMGHFSVIIALWGMLAPLAALLLHGQRNFFLKFQSIQALAFQVGTTLIYFGAGLVYSFGIFLLAATMGLTGEPNFDSPLAMLGIIIFFVSLLIALVIIMLIPLLHILGQWAGYRVLKGDDYRYPVIGKLVERRLAQAGSQTLIEPK